MAFFPYHTLKKGLNYLISVFPYRRVRPESMRFQEYTYCLTVIILQTSHFRSNINTFPRKRGLMRLASSISYRNKFLISVELSQSTSVDCTTTLGLVTSRFGTVSSRHTHVNDRQILCSLLILKLFILCSRYISCLLYTSPSPRDKRQSRMPSSA